MKDAVLSVRVSDEIKRQFIEFAKETGVNNKEFLENIMRNYELNMENKDENIYLSDIKEMQMITGRIYELYTNMINKSKVREQEKSGRIKEAIEVKDDEITRLKGVIERLNEEDKKRERVNEENKRLREELNRIKEDNESLKSLNSLLKEKNEKLLSDIKEGEKKSESFDLVKKEGAEAKIELEKKERELQLVKMKSEARELELERSIKDVTREKEELKAMGDRRIEFLEEKYKLEGEKNKIEIEKSLQEDLQRQKNSFDIKIKEYMDKRESDMDTISRLKDEINDLKNSKDR